MEEWKIADNGFAYRCGNNFREKIYITEKYDICYTAAIIADDDYMTFAILPPLLPMTIPLLNSILRL